MSNNRQEEEEQLEEQFRLKQKLDRLDRHLNSGLSNLALLAGGVVVYFLHAAQYQTAFALVAGSLCLLALSTVSWAQFFVKTPSKSSKGGTDDQG